MQSKCHLAGNRKARKYSTVLKSALSSVHLEKITTSKGEYEKALAEHEQSRAIGVELSDRRGEGVHCNNLGMSHVSLKQYDRAIERFEQSLAIQKELGDRSEQMTYTTNLGRCLSRHGQHDRAVSCLKRAWAVSQELGDAQQQACAASFLGEALLAQARAEHQGAETWLRTALDLALKQNIFR